MTNLQLTNCRIWFILAIMILRIFVSLDAAEAPKLEKQWIYKDAVTLSGYSAGGWIAHYFHIIHSKLFIGVGVFAGFYYTGTLHDSSPTITEAKRTLKKNEKAGLIDPLKNLENQKVYIWSGTEDHQHPSKRVAGVVDIYSPYLADPDNLFTKIQFNPHVPPPTGHCSRKQEPEGTYYGGCHYNGIFASFEFLLGTLKKPSGRTQVQKLIKFDQTEFLADFEEDTEMEDYGYIYIPSKCSRRHQCLMHLFFHGCHSEPLTPRYFKKYGYMQIAEVNDIIVVFPIVKNCWDNEGYTGPDYVTNKGIQVQAVRRIMERIMSGGGLS